MNIFEKAARVELRFESSRGLLTTEQLWHLPLQSKSLFDLDTIAKAANAKLKSFAEESFVTPTETPGKEFAELSLEIVKYIIAVKMAEAAEAKQASKKSQVRQEILSVIAEKQQEALKSMTIEELNKQLDAL